MWAVPPARRDAYDSLQESKGKLLSVSEWKKLLIDFAGFFEERGQFLARVGLLDFFDFGPGQGIAAFVFGVSGVTFEPLPLDEVGLAGGVEIAPEVGIFHRLAVGGHPAPLAPGVNPLGDALAQVLRVGENDDFAGLLERAEGENGGAQFHAVVGGGGVASRDGSLVCSVA